MQTDKPKFGSKMWNWLSRFTPWFRKEKASHCKEKLHNPPVAPMRIVMARSPFNATEVRQYQLLGMNGKNVIAKTIDNPRKVQLTLLPESNVLRESVEDYRDFVKLHTSTP